MIKYKYIISIEYQYEKIKQKKAAFKAAFYQ